LHGNSVTEIIVCSQEEPGFILEHNSLQNLLLQAVKHFTTCILIKKFQTRQHSD